MTIVETEAGMITGGIEMTTSKTEIIIMINMKSVTSMLIHQQLKELSGKAQMEGKEYINCRVRFLRNNYELKINCVT